MKQKITRPISIRIKYTRYVIPILLITFLSIGAIDTIFYFPPNMNKQPTLIRRSHHWNPIFLSLPPIPVSFSIKMQHRTIL